MKKLLATWLLLLALATPVFAADLSITAAAVVTGTGSINSSAVAGEAILAGELVYLKSSDGRPWTVSFVAERMRFDGCYCHNGRCCVKLSTRGRPAAVCASERDVYGRGHGRGGNDLGYIGDGR